MAGLAEIRLSSDMIASRFGRGKLESGPAMLCSTSWLDLRLILTEEGLGATKDEGGGGVEVEDEIAELVPSSVISEFGIKGRGPLRTMDSKLLSWACWWRMLCFKFDICWRRATVIIYCELTVSERKGEQTWVVKRQSHPSHVYH